MKEIKPSLLWLKEKDTKRAFLMPCTKSKYRFNDKIFLKDNGFVGKRKTSQFIGYFLTKKKNATPEELEYLMQKVLIINFNK